VTSTHTCAVVGGGVWCWGHNLDGEIGNGTTKDSLVPSQVVGLTAGVSGIAVADSHSCARLAAVVKCWGSNGNGELATAPSPRGPPRST